MHTSILNTSLVKIPFYNHFHCRTSILQPLPLLNFHSTPTSIVKLPFYTHFHCRTSILQPLPLPNFHSTPTSIVKLPFYNHFHCQTSILHPLPLSNFHSTPTSIAELPFYTHFEGCTRTNVSTIILASNHMYTRDFRLPYICLTNSFHMMVHMFLINRLSEHKEEEHVLTITGTIICSMLSFMACNKSMLF